MPIHFGGRWRKSSLVTATQADSAPVVDLVADLPEGRHNGQDMLYSRKASMLAPSTLPRPGASRSSLIGSQLLFTGYAVKKAAAGFNALLSGMPGTVPEGDEAMDETAESVATPTAADDLEAAPPTFTQARSAVTTMRAYLFATIVLRFVTFRSHTAPRETRHGPKPTHIWPLHGCFTACSSSAAALTLTLTLTLTRTTPPVTSPRDRHATT